MFSTVSWHINSTYGFSGSGSPGAGLGNIGSSKAKNTQLAKMVNMTNMSKNLRENKVKANKLQSLSLEGYYR